MPPDWNVIVLTSIPFIATAILLPLISIYVSLMCRHRQERMAKVLLGSTIMILMMVLLILLGDPMEGLFGV
jgi:branched-subunit amino acid permease